MLEPSTPNEFPNWTETPPLLIIIDRETEFEISEILDSKIDKHCKCKLQYLVKWSGYEGTNEETSWIPTSELKHMTRSVVDFHLMNPDKPGLLFLKSLCLFFLKNPRHFIIFDTLHFIQVFSSYSTSSIRSSNSSIPPDPSFSPDPSTSDSPSSQWSGHPSWVL